MTRPLVAGTRPSAVRRAGDGKTDNEAQAGRRVMHSGLERPHLERSRTDGARRHAPSRNPRWVMSYGASTSRRNSEAADATSTTSSGRVLVSTCTKSS